MRNKVQDGTSIYYTNGGDATVAGGTLVVMADLFGVAAADIAPGETGALDVEGVFRLPKVTAKAIAQGAQVYAKKLTNEITTDVSDGLAQPTAYKPVGKAWEAADAAAVVALVKINA